jgi:predicted PurR-regulated permease PerM
MVVGWMVVMNLLQPRLMAGAVGLDPFVVLASVLIGSKVAGLAGAFFGIPIAAILTGLFWHLVRANAGGEVARHAAERLAAHELLPADPGPTPTPGSHATG